MANANIELADGTKIVIEGSPDEIARVLSLYRQSSASAAGAEATHSEGRALIVRPVGDQKTRAELRPRISTGTMQHIRSLIEENFFGERRSIADVQRKLEEGGRIYPQTHLSTPLRRLVLTKELRRLRSGKNWVYVNE